MEKEKKTSDKIVKRLIIGFAIVMLLTVSYAAVSWRSGKDAAIQPETTKATMLDSVKDLEEFTDEGEFIAYFHHFYNETVCYGRVNSLNWEEQAAAASAILHSLTSLKPANEDLAKDFKNIAKLVQEIENNEKDKSNVKTLHRYFHDLDIHYNGYAESSQVFRVTKFK
ncbi:hypothetical protein [Priestia abyssalis]|uniref:hypothetical protein n=1 Tax=Priestia abyssalis TaxID=1221450 RepID=UPI000994F8DD|nr:hypothetical protein [Priestia abyssalis]